MGTWKATGIPVNWAFSFIISLVIITKILILIRFLDLHWLVLHCVAILLVSTCIRPNLKCFVWTCDYSRGLLSIGIALDLLQANACTENISFSSEIKIKVVVVSVIIFYFVTASTQKRVNETLRSVEQNFVRCIQKCCLTRTFFPIFVAVFQLHCKSPYW